MYKPLGFPAHGMLGIVDPLLTCGLYEMCEELQLFIHCQKKDYLDEVISHGQDLITGNSVHLCNNIACYRCYIAMGYRGGI